MAYTPARDVPVIVQVRDALEQLLGLAHATGMLVMDADPVATDTIVLNDGVTERTLTFVTNLSGAAEEVRLETSGEMVGVTAPVSAAADYALQTATHNSKRVWYSPTTGLYIYWDGTDTWMMNDNLGVDSPGGAWWELTNADPENVGGFIHKGTATGDCALTLTDETADTLANIIATINLGQEDPDTKDAKRGLWATDATVGAGTPTILITNTVAGSLGNVTITTTGDPFTVTGMVGGTDGGPTRLRTVAISDNDGDTQAVAAEWSALDLSAVVSPGTVVDVIFSVSELSWVVPMPSATAPAAANAGVGEQFKPNLNFRIPAADCSHLYYQAVNQANQAVITISAVVRV